MKKIGLLLITFVLSFNVIATPRIIPNAPAIAARGYLLIDFDSGKVLAENNSEERLEPASLTKMMTSYIIGREIKSGNLNPTDKVTISEKAWSKNFPDSSKMFIEVGKEVTVEDLNRGIIVQSGNDACVAMAEHIAGSEGAFADLMNTWALQLGMNNTHFVNSHGLHAEGHYTTALDMAILAKALITDVPDEYHFYSEKSFKFNGIVQYNRNGLLWDKSLNVDGIKTGHTSDAGYSLVSSATKEGMRLISVVMGTKSETARKVESKKLLNWGFRFFETITPYNAGDQLANERIWMGSQQTIRLGVAVNTPITVPRGQAKNLDANFVIKNELRAPLKKGDKVGEIHYSIAQEPIATYDLIALESVDEGGIFSRLIDYIKLLFIGWFA
ncbi:serine hydrolase [Psychromonas antarctica]|jgi:D-alanyl-D-alanine carboxypeptidase (penicillin-binding protein 5/6)|uniref:serine hydrolase n=1 Tax=Psychromonas antarctica TaxID=67573 RepID=UPI001EE8EA9B|nr:serine hydrolase [Psychromonas antarctica]MCG6199850.1 serine hydrolase [Psychromonas antarctica]